MLKKQKSSVKVARKVFNAQLKSEEGVAGKRRREKNEEWDVSGMSQQNLK